MPEDGNGYDDGRVEALLRSLDHDLPGVGVEDVIARARRPRVPWARIAAGIAAFLALGGVAYALPGSPVRPWVDRALERLTRAEEAPALPESPDPGGIAFDHSDHLAVVFTGPLQGHVRITLTQGGELVARSAPGSARFTSEPRRLLVEMLEPDTFELRIPAAARRVEVLAGGRRLFLFDGGEISAAPPPGADGDYLLPLDRPSP